eukprot:TRINITY_DN11055_c0_g1_i1.p1 TRINITY_DN11055_c0_g1~~TRINITY_DN11055_c0_g1_i1.p1  ORF type:complete len:1107 (+),score=476.25 TRINITY_DN11055_c0_g1_i1:88-3408(+)
MPPPYAMTPGNIAKSVTPPLEGGAGKAWERVAAEHPEPVQEMLSILLHRDVLMVLQTADAAQPFADDLEFLAVAELCLISTYHWFSMCTGSMHAPMQKEMQHLQVRLPALTRGVAACRDLLYALLQSRLAAMPKPPLALRLCDQLGLSPAETRAFVFLLLCHGGIELRTFTDVQPLVVSTARFSGMSSHELMCFLSEERDHFKQGLVGSLDRSKNLLSSSQTKLKMPQEVVAVLYRAKLCEAEFLKLDKTSLEALVEEEGLVKLDGAQEQSADEGEEDEEMDEDEVHRVASPAVHGRKRKGGAAAQAPPQKQPRQTAPAPATAPAAAPPPRADAPTPPCSPAPDGEKADAEDASVVPPAAGDAGVLPKWSPTVHNLLCEAAPGGVMAISGDQGPYTHDLQYLDDMFKLLATQIRLRTTESDLKDDDPELLLTPKSKQEALLRELKGKERMLKHRIERRMLKTTTAGMKLPQMEALQHKRGYSNFEKMVLLLLVGNIMSHEILIAANGKYVMRGESQRECTVGYILYVLCETLEERMSRRAVFYKNAALQRDGLTTVTSRGYGGGDLMECSVDIDRRMVDQLMGLETELHEVVEGSHLYSPTVRLDNVVLPVDHKALIMSTVTNYDAFQRCKQRVGLEDIVSYGSGLTMLFYGPSGTGKTMLANAIAHEMGKRVLLVSLEQVRASGKSPELLRFVFREAKLNEALIFFDECDAIFEARDNNPIIPQLLQELEKYSGLMIMATNRAQSLDEAMNRRITLAIEFHLPDHHMRCEIWRKHVPPSLKVCDGVDWEALAMDYELTGGLIKNAVLTSISNAVSREGGNDNPTLRTEDFIKGAKTQLRCFLKKDLQQSHLVPRRSLDDCIFDAGTRRRLDEYVQLHKGKRHLHSVWGFKEEDFREQNPLLLLYGPSGTGKTLAAEAIGYECGHPQHTVNVQELFIKTNASQKTIAQVFEQAKQGGAMLVLDEAQELFNFSAESRELSQLIHYYAKHCARPVVVIARTDGEVVLDPASAGLIAHRSIRFGVPSQELRQQHWRKALPDKLPHDALALDAVAERPLSPGAIRSAVYFAAAKAAMLPLAQRRLTRELLDAAIDDVVRLREGRVQSIYT